MHESSPPSPRQNVDTLQYEGRTFHIIGTAHVSESSVQLVKEVIEEIKPQAVAIELCAARYDALQDPDRWKKTDIISIIRQGRLGLLVAQLMLSSFQRKLGKELKVAPGQEMLEAATRAKAIGAEIFMADRDVKVTLKRTWAALSLWQKLKLIVLGPLKLLEDEKVDEKEIERLKQGDVLEEAMRELSQQFPGVKTALIDERDLYLTAKIRETPGNPVVAVVGAGHVPGIKAHFQNPIDLAPISSPPLPTWRSKLLGWAFGIVFIGFLVYGFVSGGTEGGKEMLLSWVATNALFAGLGAAIALAHPLSVLAAAISAPITVIHPMLASGWFAGLTEAFLRKPTVSDLESVVDDVTSIKGLMRNRVLHIIMITALTNLVGMLGGFIAVGQLASIASSLSSGGH